MNRLILVQCLLVILIACSASKKTTSGPSVQESIMPKEVSVTVPASALTEKDTLPSVFKIDTVFKMSKGACFGNCPVYELSILNDGTVILNGIRNIAKGGMHVAKLDQKQINELQQKSKLFFTQNYSPFYPEKKHEIISEFPTTTYTFFDKSQSRKIVVNNSAPKSLYEITDKIDSWLANTEWIKIQP